MLMMKRMSMSLDLRSSWRERTLFDGNVRFVAWKRKKSCFRLYLSSRNLVIPVEIDNTFVQGDPTVKI
jgi:hypothetical protein